MFNGDRRAVILLCWEIVEFAAAFDQFSDPAIYSTARFVIYARFPLELSITMSQIHPPRPHRPAFDVNTGHDCRPHLAFPTPSSTAV